MTSKIERYSVVEGGHPFTVTKKRDAFMVSSGALIIDFLHHWEGVWFRTTGRLPKRVVEYVDDVVTVDLPVEVFNANA